MSNPIIAFILKSLSGAAQAAEETFLVGELEQLFAADKDEYTAVIYAGNALVKGLGKVKLLQSGFGAAVLEGIEQAVEESAAAHGITLPATAVASIAAASKAATTDTATASGDPAKSGA